MTEFPKPARVADRFGERWFREAAILLSRCAGLWFDAQERQRGWQIHYAVDVDVITSYLNPERAASYGLVFQDDSEFAQKLLVRMLGEFLLCGLEGSAATASNRGSLLIISPHDEELDGMLTAVHNKVSDHVGKAPGQLERAAKMLRHASDDDVAEFLLERASELMDVVAETGGLAEAARFARLPPGRLLNSLRLELPCGEGTVVRLPRPPVDADNDEFSAYADVYAKWKKALERGLRGEKPDISTRRDARALATLEWTNEKIAPLKQRLVLITGSRSIFMAESALAKVHGARGREDRFGDKYLRHLHAFLGHENFFETANPQGERSESQEFRLFNWLNLIFPDYISTQNDAALLQFERIRELIVSVPGRWSSIAQALPRFEHSSGAVFNAGEYLEHLYQRWTSQVQLVAVERGLAWAAETRKSQALRVVAALKKHVGSDTAMHRFRTYLADRAGRALVGLYKDSSSSYMGVVAVGGDGPIHGVPALRFDLPKAQIACVTVQELMFKNAGAVNFADIYAALREVDPFNYHALVIRALVYAVRGHWLAASTLCESALEVIAITPVESRGHVHGREANYLLAVAKRRLADSPAKLEASLATLKLAEDLVTGESSDPRFASERIANSCAQYNLKRFFFRHDHLEEPRAAQLLEALLPKALDLVNELDPEEIGMQAEAWVTRQCYTAMINLALLAEEDVRGSLARLDQEGDLSRLRAAMRGLRLSPDAEGSYSDVESDFLFWAETAMREQAPEARERAAMRVAAYALDAFGRERTRMTAIAELVRSRCVLQLHGTQVS